MYNFVRFSLTAKAQRVHLALRAAALRAAGGARGPHARAPLRARGRPADAARARAVPRARPALPPAPQEGHLHLQRGHQGMEDVRSNGKVDFCQLSNPNY